MLLMGKGKPGKEEEQLQVQSRVDVFVSASATSEPPGRTDSVRNFVGTVVLTATPLTLIMLPHLKSPLALATQTTR